MSLSLPVLAREAREYPGAIAESDFDRIVRRHQRKVYRVMLLMLKSPEDADNLTQECFLRAFTSRANFRGDCSLQTWLMRIAMNLARDHLRSRRAGFWKRLLRLDDSETALAEQAPVSVGPSPERGLLAREQLDAVWQVVDQLSARQKEVFILRFVEEMELREIAEVLNLSTGTVKAQLFRAVSRIREQVGR